MSRENAKLFFEKIENDAELKMLSDAELEGVAGGSASDMTGKDLLNLQQSTSELSNSLSMISSMQKSLSEMVKNVMGNLRVF